MRKLQANIINGVYEVEDFEVETVDENFFLEYLDLVEENEIIAAVVSEEMYNKIDEKYGIKYGIMK